MIVNVPGMRKKLGFGLSFLLLFIEMKTASAQEYIVKIKGGSTFQNSLSFFESEENIKIHDTHAKGRLISFSLTDKSIDAEEHHLESLKSNPSVEYIVKNIKLHAFEAPNDPEFSSQWALKKVRAIEAWKSQKGSNETVVAVIDTGINWDHVDLTDNIWVNPKEIPGNGIDDDQNGFVDDIRGWDFRDNDNDPDDETSNKNPGHGTHCAGIIGAVANNQEGISGIAQGVSLMPVRFLGSDGSGDLMTAAKAIDYATDNGAHVISASWGAAVQRSQVNPILEAIERAQKQGVIFVAAAANDGKSNDSREVYPANAGFDNVISVAASSPDDTKPSWSNFGKAKVDLSAPGLNILSTIPGDKYQKLSGTSMATPLVAGTVSLLLQQAKEENRELKPIEVRSILQSTGSKVEIETACNCRIDVAAALENIQKEILTVVPNAGSVSLDDTKSFYAIGGREPFTFSSSNPKIATISESGELKALAEGEVVLTVTDADGITSNSCSIYVGQTSTNDSECPFGPLCPVMCTINPKLPWC